MSNMDNEKIGLLYEGLGSVLAHKYAGWRGSSNRQEAGGFKTREEAVIQGKLESLINSFKKDLTYVLGKDYLVRAPQLRNLISVLDKVYANYQGGNESEWYKHGSPHQEDGPAVETVTQWDKVGNPHTTEDGPAVEHITPKTTIEAQPEDNEPTTLNQKEIRKINPNAGLLNKKQAIKLKKRLVNEPKIQKRFKEITGKSVLNPRTRYNYKQIMALKRLIGESMELSFDEAYNSLN